MTEDKTSMPVLTHEAFANLPKFSAFRDEFAVEEYIIIGEGIARSIVHGTVRALEDFTLPVTLLSAPEGLRGLYSAEQREGDGPSPNEQDHDKLANLIWRIETIDYSGMTVRNSSQIADALILAGLIDVERLRRGA